MPDFDKALEKAKQIALQLSQQKRPSTSTSSTFSKKQKTPTQQTPDPVEEKRKLPVPFISTAQPSLPADKKVKSSSITRFTKNVSERGHAILTTTVPSHFISFLLGRGGDAIKNIERVCGVTITVEYEAQSEEKPLNLSGKEKDVDEAKAMLDKIMVQYEDIETVEHLVPNSRVGLVIGRGGETIREIQDKSGAKIGIGFEKEEHRIKGERVIIISGKKECVERARRCVDELVSFSFVVSFFCY